MIDKTRKQVIYSTTRQDSFPPDKHSIAGLNIVQSMIQLNMPILVCYVQYLYFKVRFGFWLAVNFKTISDVKLPFES